MGVAGGSRLSVFLGTVIIGLFLSPALGSSSARADVDCGKVITVRMVIAACGANAPAVAAHGPLRVWPDEEHEGYDGVVCQRVVGWPESQVFLTVRRLPTAAEAEEHVGGRIDRVARQAYLNASTGYSPPEMQRADGRTFTSWRGPSGTNTVVFPAGSFAVEVTARRRAAQNPAPPLICTLERLGGLARRVASGLEQIKLD